MDQVIFALRSQMDHVVIEASLAALNLHRNGENKKNQEKKASELRFYK